MSKGGRRAKAVVAVRRSAASNIPGKGRRIGAFGEIPWPFPGMLASLGGYAWNAFHWWPKSSPGLSSYENNNLRQIDVCVTEGDRYEEDDTCEQARAIPTDGTVQQRTFDPQGDVDWVKFAVMPDTFYTAVAVGEGPHARPLVKLWETCPAGAAARGSSGRSRLRFNAHTGGWRYLYIQNGLTDYQPAKTAYTLAVYAHTSGSLGGERIYLPLAAR